jgi:catechol 2,3-dioxygenase-like lactoylglutathione lyase family enzyme
MTKANFKRAVPYAQDEMNLPVDDVEKAVPFYETIMGFSVISKTDSPYKSVALARDNVKIGLAENGGDPTQEGCFFEVDDVELAFAELHANGLDREDPKFSLETYEGGHTYKIFFVVAPDGLCYCLGQPQPS